VTANTGTVATSGRTINVSGLTLFGGALAITYGSRSGGGPGALVPSTPGTATWTAKQRSGSPGTLTPLSTSPSTTVFAPDGSGTLTTPTSSVARGSTGNTISFTYTAAAGGMSNGSVAVRVPPGWSAPSTTGTSAGFSTASTGTLSTSGQTIIVSGVTLAGGATLTVTYGATGGGGPGATAPNVHASQLWRGAQASTPGSRTVLASSPMISLS